MLYIDGVQYYVDLLERGEKHQLPQPGDKVTSRDLNVETCILQQELDKRIAEIKINLFCTKDDEETLEVFHNDLSNRLKNTEFNTKKLNA